MKRNSYWVGVGSEAKRISGAVVMKFRFVIRMLIQLLGQGTAMPESFFSLMCLCAHSLVLSFLLRFGFCSCLYMIVKLRTL